MRIPPGRDVAFREMTPLALTGADLLRRLAGWNQTPEDWRRLLALEPHGCFVALWQGNVVGTVTVTTYGKSLAWIGMMLVHPDHRGCGIGTRLMHHALDYLQNAATECIKLDATPAGQPLYEKLDFVAEGSLTRFHRPAGCKAVDAEARLGGARRLNDEDWGALEAIDQAAFGAPRAVLLRSLAHDAKTVLVLPSRGAVTGYGMLRPGSAGDYLGPIVSLNPESAVTLTGALLAQAGARPLVWDVPDQCHAAKEAAQRFGFVPQRTLTRMRHGPDRIVSDLTAQFAIADPAVG